MRSTLRKDRIILYKLINKFKDEEYRRKKNVKTKAKRTKSRKK